MRTSDSVGSNHYTLHFLDAHMRNSKHRARFMAGTAETLGVPPG